MNRTIVIAIISLILGLLIGVFLSGSLNLTGNVVEDKDYTYTTAVCNIDNECIDVTISCQNGRVTDIVPLLFVVKHPKNWTDIRGNVTAFC